MMRMVVALTLLVVAATAAARAEERYADKAEAAKAINQALAWTSAEFDPGAIAVALIDVHPQGIAMVPRFSPDDGLQVAFTKGRSERDGADGSICAPIVLQTEYFTEASRRDLIDRRIRVPDVESMDRYTARACVAGTGRVMLRDVEIVRRVPQNGRKATQPPYVTRGGEL